MKIGKKAAQYMVKLGAISYLGSAILCLGYTLYRTHPKGGVPTQISLAEKLDSDLKRSIPIRDALDEKVLEQYREKARRYDELIESPEYQKNIELEEQEAKNGLFNFVLMFGGFIISGASYVTSKIILDKLDREEKDRLRKY